MPLKYKKSTAMRAKLLLNKILIKLKLIDELHYIGGPEVLPPPLSPEREQEIMRLLASTGTDLHEELIVHNLRLVVYIARKFDNTKSSVEDLISIGTIGLIKAVNTYKPEKQIKLATYASRCIENEILMHLRKTNNQKGEISIDEPLNVDWDGNELLLSDILGSEPDTVGKGVEIEDERSLLRKLVDKLSMRERQIMQMRFGLAGFNEHTQKEVADNLGISQSYISRLEKRIIERLKRDIEKAG